ncbi:MAG: family peptidase [Thermoplasmata archaeon]|jgi:putative protease|nr:family peptidase [Thermoplasmata archaeon]
MPPARVVTSFRLPLAKAAQAKRVELLAPAGSFEALVAAVENGADAVYLAGQHFGARKFAKNFTDEELRAGIDFAHVRGVKVFVTVNTLVFNDEFADLVPFLATIREAGADAVIVQDLGIMRILRDLFPDLPLHISTQATVHNSKGVKWLEDLGAERAILAREMTLKDITQMKQKSGAELETFVHGALCYCYSGQCLMSSVIGERSGNRGACAYTCRLPYDMTANGEVMPEVEQKHVLSSKDLNQIESIPQLIESGVTSFKIEGRMKRPEYVAVVTRAYRTAIERYYAGDFHITAAEHKAVMAVFNREFTPGYLEGKEKWAFTSWDTDGNRGTPLGEVVASGRGFVTVKLFDALHVKDGISVIHAPHEGSQRDEAPEEYGFTVTQIDFGGRWITEATPGMTVTLKGFAPSGPGDKVYKTADHETLETARATFQGPPLRRVGVALRATLEVGKPIRVELRDTERDVTATHEGFVVQPARKAPLAETTVREHVTKLSETPFDADTVEVRVAPNAFVPLGELNEARRGAVAALEKAIAERYHRAPLAAPAPPTFPTAQRRRALSLAVNCWGLDNVRAALEGGARTIYYTGLKVGGLQPKWDPLVEAAALAEAHGAKLWIASGMIQKDWEVEALRDAVREIRASPAFAGVLAGNHGACQVAKEEGVPFVADWPINVYNSVTTNFLTQHGAARITLSPELTLEQMADVARHTEAPLEALVHGRLTLMTSEYCSIGHATACQMPGGTWAPCHETAYSLQDRTGARFPLATDGACRMYILNAVELAMLNRLPDLAAAGLDVLRIESIGTAPDALREQVRLYLQVLARPGHAVTRGEWKALETTCPDGFTTGHFYRGPA